MLGWLACATDAQAATNTPPQAGLATALQFDGSDDYVLINDAAALDLTNNYSIECWFRADSFGSLRGLVTKYQTGGANGWLLRLNGTEIDFDQQVTSGLNLQTGRWYHVAAVNDNGTRRLYLDGKAQSLTGSPLTVQPNSDPVRLASDYSGRYFAGRLDEVRIWKTPLSGVVVSNWMYREADPTHPEFTNLVAYYKLNNATGTVASDSAGVCTGALQNMSATPWTDSTVGREYSMTTDGPLGGQLPAADPDGASSNGADWALTFEILNAGTIGTATLVSANAFTYSAPLVADTNDAFTYRVRDSSNEVSNVSTVRVAVLYPRPAVDITNAGDSVSGWITTYTIGGANNEWVTGLMRWTNAARNASGEFPVAGSTFQVENIPLAIGANVITVSGTNSVGMSAADSVTITRRPDAGPGSPIHYAWTNSPQPAWPFTNWSTAAHTIQEALDAAYSNDTVLATNGVYSSGGAVTPGASLSNRACVTMGITLQSVNGPDSAFIVGTTAVRCVFIDPGATVSGFTLTNGAAIDAAGTRNNAGGGVFLSGGALTNCIVTGNRAPATFEFGIAGGILAEGGTINNCVISGNSAAYYGGGIYGSPALNNCVLRDNSSQIGGALALSGGQVNNCLFTENYSTEEASAVYAFGDSEINHCTFAANIYGKNDVGCVLVDDGSVTFRNCIFAGNLGGVELFGGAYDHCCAAGLAGSGNITNDPQFVNSAEGDYRLGSGSPCVDSGINGYATASSLDGGARVVNGIADMGAYEFQRLIVITNPPGAISVTCTTAVYSVSGTNTPTLVGNLSWTNPATGATGSVAAVSGKWQIAGVSLRPGDNRIRVSGIDASGFSCCDAVLIHRAPRDPGISPIHYVCADSVAPLWPFTNWATAARTIQDAVDTANTNELILVSNGVYNAGGVVTPGYTLMNRLCLTSPVTVRAVGGPSATFIVGAMDTAHTGSPRSVRCAYLTAGTTLDGFTLMNGDTSTYGNRIREACGGGAILQNGGALSNCIISGCWSRGRGLSGVQGGGGVICDAGGTLFNCIVRSNWSMTDGGGVYLYNGGLAMNCLLSGNTARWDGGGAYYYHGGALSNCTVSGNSAGTGSGIAFDTSGRLNNSIVYFNQGAPSDIANPMTIATSCGPSLSGGGNISSDPKFVNAAAGNYRLQTSSPCVNAGANATWMTNAVDLDGNPRIYGSAVDMGAYERHPPPPGNCLAFDGTNDFVLVADADSLDLTNHFTLECWFKPASFGALRGLISKYQTAGAEGYLLRLTTNNLDFDQLVTSNLNLQADRWYHVAAVNSGGAHALYLNGVTQKLYGTAFVVKTNANTLRLGSDYGGRYFDGQMDEVRIWNVARSEVDIRDAMHREITANESGLVAYYRFDETSGSVLPDLAPYGNPGAISNGAGWTASTFPCADGLAALAELRGAWIARTGSLASSIFSVSNAAVAGVDFRVFGHDHGALTNRTSDTPARCAWRLDRAWQVEGPGTLTGTLVFDCSGITNLIASGARLRLLADSDGAFSNANVVTGTYAAGQFAVAGQSVPTGGYYTIGEHAVRTITAGAGSHGAINPTGDVQVLYAESTNFVITPDTYWHVGDVTTNGASIGAVTSFTWSNVVADGTIHAEFAANLAARGTPDWWLAQYGWTNNFDYWETNDTDSDAFQAWAEQIAGTDPTNFSSRFQISSFKFQGTNTVVTWDAVTGRLYSIEANTNSLVTDHWSLITNGLPPTGVWTDTTHGADNLINYRLGVEKP